MNSALGAYQTIQVALTLGFLLWGSLWSNYLTIICSRIMVPKKVQCLSCMLCFHLSA